MTLKKPIALEDLDKTELLCLIRNRLPFLRETDLITARWDAASSHWKRLNAEAERLRAPVCDLARAVDQAKAGPAFVAAVERYSKASKAADAAQRRADRAWANSQALYQQLQGTTRRQPTL